MYPKLIMFPNLPRYGTVYSEVLDGKEIIYKNYGRVFTLKEGTTDIISERQIINDEIENTKRYIESSLKARMDKMDKEIMEMRLEQAEFRREVEAGRTW